MPSSSSRLYEAAFNGDVATLQEMLRQDRRLLDRSTLSDWSPKPPLHVAAFCGHIDFVKTILQTSPQLAQELDGQRLSPLHLAATNGHREIIRELLRVDGDLCFLCDNDGRNPLHFAAMNGQVGALEELIGDISCRQAGADVNRLLNAKDDYGFTMLHFAVRNEQVETVRYLVETMPGIEVDALNSNGLTSLDILAKSPCYEKARTIGKLLRKSGASCSTALLSTNSREIWARKKDALMVVASLIATMAFQAAVNPPGGVWQEDNSSDPGHVAGKSIMSAKHPMLYTLFIMSTSFAFLLSLLELILLMSNSISNSRPFFMVLVVYIKYLSTLSLVSAYWISIAFLVKTSVNGVLFALASSSVAMLLLLLKLIWVFKDAGRVSAVRPEIKLPSQI